MKYMRENYGILILIIFICICFCWYIQLNLDKILDWFFSYCIDKKKSVKIIPVYIIPEPCDTNETAINVPPEMIRDYYQNILTV